MKRSLPLSLAALALSAAAPAAAAPTTLDQTVTATGGDFKTLTTGPGWSRVVREDLARGASGREARRRNVLYFSQLSDFQLADEESPARVEFLDVQSTPFTAAWRPQEAFVPHIVDQSIRQVNEFAGASAVPAAGGKRPAMDFVITTGDSADSQQRNETNWVVALLEGGRINPNSGVEGSCPGVPAGEAARYTGVQDYDDYLETSPFYDPDVPNGPYAAWPRYPGLMDRAQQPFDAVGLKVPSYVAFGNHDALVQGNQAANPGIGAIATGCVKVFGPTLLEGLTPTFPTSNPAQLGQVPSDPERRFVTRAEYRGLHGGSGKQADAHGFAAVDPDEAKASAGDAGYYSWAPKKGFRFIAIDTVCNGGVSGPSADGNIDDPQFQWLKREITAAEKRGELIFLFGHHPIRSLTCAVPDEVAPPGSAPGSDIDPRNSSPIHRGPDLQALLLKHPLVVSYVAGHTHEHKTTPFKSADGKSGFWGIETASHVDWPIQSRLIDLMDNKDGTVSLFGTILDTAGAIGTPGGGANAAGFTSEQISAIGRTLSANDPQNGVTTGSGTPSDRNVELLMNEPPGSTVLGTDDPGGGSRAVAGLRLKVSRTCKARVTLSVVGKRRKQVKRADFRRGKKRLAKVDRRSPFKVRVKRSKIGRKGKRVKLSVRVVTKDRGRGTITRRVRLCKRR